MKVAKPLSLLPVLFLALAATVCNQAVSAQLSTTLSTQGSKPFSTRYKQTTVPFLSPMVKVSALRSVGVAQLDSAVDDYATEQPPHLQVIFGNGRVDHVAVANGGVIGNKSVNWNISSGVVTWETNWNPSYSVPAEGSFYQFDAPFYIGEVSNGCGNVDVFPIEFDSAVYSGDQVFGFFSAVDVETIQPNGYWKFAYTIRIYDSMGGISDIKTSGDVSALCVW